MKKLFGRLFALALVIAAIASAPVPSAEAACCTQAERLECRIGCAEAGCIAQITCPQNTCGCFCFCN